ncbi:MAG: response regulator transcription factor [Oscillospiraceae bacterium]|nr:response regulator transcription factor [Oscillospiraceae bacterium]
MIRIAICDDDKVYIENVITPILNRAVKAQGVTAEIKEFTDGSLLISEFEQGSRYDIVLLDIDMPQINGKQVAEKLRIIDSGFCLAFITSFRTEVFNTIPYRINAFIPKDSSENKLLSELIRVIGDYKAYSPECSLFEVANENGRSVVKIPIDDIFCFCCVRRTVYLKTGSKSYQLTEKKISAFAEEYADKGFFEVCRGYVVNISKIKSVNSTDIELDNGEMLPLSRRRAKELLTRISEYVTERAGL